MPLSSPDTQQTTPQHNQGGNSPFTYTHLTLPTKKAVKDSETASAVKKNKKKKNK